MRPARLAMLVRLGLLLGGAGAQAQRQKQPPMPARSNPSWDVQGSGMTRDDAEIEALEKARRQILAYLAEEGVVLSWEPSLNDIRGLVRDWKPVKEKNLETVGLVKE